jgi:hypothetical protein
MPPGQEDCSGEMGKCEADQGRDHHRPRAFVAGQQLRAGAAADQGGLEAVGSACQHGDSARRAKHVE